MSAQAAQLWGPLLSTGTPVTAGHSHWHSREQGQGDANTRIDGLAAGEPNSACQCQERRLALGPQAVCRKGFGAVHVLYCDCRLSSQVHTWRQPVMGLRPAACRCAAGGAGPLCVHGNGVRCSDLGCVLPPGLLQTSGLTASVDPVLQGELEGGEDGGGRYTSCWRLQR